MLKKERGLGRGLEALLSDGINLPEGTSITDLDVAEIIAKADQPRRRFNEESIKELADSIKEHGLLQPLIVRPSGEEYKYEIIAGERRWRAARIAGLDRIPAVIKEIDDLEAAEISLVENIQRDDLSPIEEAMAYKNMIDRFNYTQEMVAERVGKSRAHITNTIRILGLSPEIIQMIEDGKLTSGHARTLLALGNGTEQMAAALEIVTGKLSVRETEKKVREKKKARPINGDKSIEVADLEERLQNHLGTRTEIITRKKGGKIEISFYSPEDLERILELIGVL